MSKTKTRKRQININAFIEALLEMKIEPKGATLTAGDHQETGLHLRLLLSTFTGNLQTSGVLGRENIPHDWVFSKRLIEDVCPIDEDENIRAAKRFISEKLDQGGWKLSTGLDQHGRNLVADQVRGVLSISDMKTVTIPVWVEILHLQYRDTFVSEIEIQHLFNENQLAELWAACRQKS